MAITRITAVWNGFRGAPGYSNFFLTGGPLEQGEVETAAVALQAFFADIRGLLPEDVSISIRETADTLDEASGQIIGQVDFSAPAATEGAATGGYSAASGAVVNWNTTAFVNGRRVRGRTFLVPLANAAYDANGDLGTGALSTLRESASELITAAGPSPLVVWSRPRGGSGGSAHVISTSSVPDLGAILRSRRD